MESHDWYTPDGVFDAARVAEQYRELIDESLDRGLKGLYVSADAADLFDYLSGNPESLLKFENSVGRVFNIPAEAICAYRLNQALLNSETFLQLVGAHKKTITPSNFVNNRIACFKTMVNVFYRIFGDHITQTVFSRMEREFKIYLDQFPDRMGDFEKTLEQIYDRSTASMIMDQIAKEFVQKELHIGRLGSPKEESSCPHVFY
ncbi:MEDS domain-containing protein [Candidatus Bathyarchaeota archaeon]|nr:MEDS domain-containing protein [Candidatus Bathyarchaeota archaeon]